MSKWKSYLFLLDPQLPHLVSYTSTRIGGIMPLIPILIGGITNAGITVVGKFLTQRLFSIVLMKVLEHALVKIAKHTDNTLDDEIVEELLKSLEKEGTPESKVTQAKAKVKEKSVQAEASKPKASKPKPRPRRSGRPNS